MENLAEGTIGDVGTPDAPIAVFNLVILPSKNFVSGTVVIKQSAKDSDDITMKVEGKIHATGFGQFTKVVSLYGQYMEFFPTETIGTFLADFDAHFLVDDSWNGTGGFTYYKNQIENVPVEATKVLNEEFV
jgi:hypothetical protein